jgi:hypothetical protein
LLKPGSEKMDRSLIIPPSSKNLHEKLCIYTTDESTGVLGSKAGIGELQKKVILNEK